MVSMTSKTELKNDSLQIALTQIHKIELEKKYYGLQGDIDRRR